MNDVSAVCLDCGRSFGWVDVESVAMVGDIRLRLCCSQCGFRCVARADALDWVRWIGEHTAVFRQLLDDVSVGEILDSWADQLVADPSSIPADIGGV